MPRHEERAMRGLGRAKFLRIRWIGAVALAGAIGWSVDVASAQDAELRLSPEDAVARALRANLELEYAKLNPLLTTAAQDAAEAAFDPTIFSGANVVGSPGTVSASRIGLAPASSTQGSGEAGVRKSFVTGTTFEARLATSGLFGDSRALNPAYQTGLYLDVRQPLLRGVSIAANEAPMTSAKLGREAAQDRLSRQADVIAADTLRAYWDLHAALANVKVQEVALSLAEKTLAETETLIAAGKLAPAESVVARYQVQTQKRTVVAALQSRDNARDRLARLIGLVGARSLETPRIVTSATPETVVPATDPQSLQGEAMRYRGDYRALSRDAEARRVEVDAARHQLLPKLDLVASVGLTGLSGTSTSGEPGAMASSYFASYGMDRVGWSVGVMLEIPLFNRAAKAKVDVASLERRRADLMIERAAQVLSEELNVAWRAVRTAREQLSLSDAAAEVASTKVQNELERYRNGKTSAQILTTMQAELTRELAAKEQAVADFQKALVELRTATGTLLAAKRNA
jgi:outer membrane protein TolC